MNDAATELSVSSHYHSKGKQTIAPGFLALVPIWFARARLTAPCTAAKSKLVRVGVQMLTQGSFAWLV